MTLHPLLQLLSVVACVILGGCVASVPTRSTGLANAHHTVRYAGSFQRTVLGVRVFIPQWLDQAAEFRAEVLGAIDAARVPPHITVYVRDPGLYALSQSETGLARGHTDAWSVIHVAFRTTEHAILPSLDHEMGHVRTQDPEEGH